MQTTPPVQIDVRNAITSLALLVVGAALRDRAPGQTAEVLCDEPGLAGELGRVFRDWACEAVRPGEGCGGACCIITLRRRPPA